MVEKTSQEESVRDMFAKGEENSDSEDDLTISLSVPKGKPKSGRIWKSEKKRAHSAIKTPGLKMSLEQKFRLRDQLKRAKLQTREIKEARAKQKEEHRLRRVENMKRKEENRKKSEIVQVIKNPAKIRKMKRKHLRAIEKRDTLFVHDMCKRKVL